MDKSESVEGAYEDRNMIMATAESQYWIAPFIIEYLYKNKSYLDENCIAYLQEETNMQLNEPTQ